MKIISTLSLVVLSLASVAFPIANPARSVKVSQRIAVDSPVKPVVVSPTLSALGNGQSTTVTVTFNQVAPSATAVSINLIGLSGPSSVTLPSGQSQLSFSVTSDGSGDMTVQASANGGSAFSDIRYTE